MGIIWIVVVGAVAGFVGGKLLRPNEYGLRVDIIAGVVGAFVSAFLVRVLSNGVGMVWSAILAVIGASILLVTMRQFMSPAPVATRRPRRRR